jgi:uncharacterized protein (DUF2252 family)
VAAPRVARVKMPTDQAERVGEGARYLSPFLGKRMRAVKLRARLYLCASFFRRISRSKSSSSHVRK